MKVISIIWMAVITICAIGMLYGAVTTTSPVQGIWIGSCVIMVIASVYACFKVWKERWN